MRDLRQEQADMVRTQIAARGVRDSQHGRARWRSIRPPRGQRVRHLRPAIATATARRLWVVEPPHHRRQRVSERVPSGRMLA
jgi:hypothetical protein